MRQRGISDVAAKHDQFALHDIDDVEHAPDERHAISRQRKNRTGEQSVQHNVESERRVLNQKKKIISHAVSYLYPKPYRLSHVGIGARNFASAHFSG